MKLKIIQEEIELNECPVAYFAKISDYGRKPNAMLLESADIVPKYGEQSLGTADPCLKISGKNESFRIEALNKTGERFIKVLHGDFDFCNSVDYGKKTITGTLKPSRKKVSEEERLQLKTHMDILRIITFKFMPEQYSQLPYGGLFGAFSYDFIDQFEELPKVDDRLDLPDYEFFYVDNLFITNHKTGKTLLIANALITDDESSAISECFDKISYYKKQLFSKLPAKQTFNNKITETSFPSKDEFEENVRKIKQHIVKGDVFQTVISRTTKTTFNDEPLDIYSRLRKLNPSPYMFYINNSKYTLFGASPEMSLRVQNKIIEIRPIAGTKPRGLINGKIDQDLDSKYETELKTDPKELAEHTMLIDLARNDIARIAKPGTRFVDEALVVEKYSHVQHLVSNVRGELKPNLDAFHAYLASMNMGTLTGAPKVEAMKLIRKYEKTTRSFYGGAVGYITPSGNLDSTIVIRSVLIKNKFAYISAGAGIVADSIPENEFLETEKKAAACLKAIRGDSK